MFTHRHRVHLLLVEAGREQPVGHQPEAVLDRRVRRLAEIGREHRVLGPGGADRLEDALPGDLAGVRRREAALEQGAARGERGLVVDRQALRREVGMRDHDLAHALLERRVDDGEDLVAREVAGREHEAVPRDRAEHGPRLGQHGAVGVDDRHRLELEARRAQLALQLHPDRDPRPRRELRLLAALVDGVDRREPDGARALARGDLDRDGVHPADGAVERDRPEHLDAGNGRAHDRRALRGRGVVRLQLEPAEPELGEAACERHVVDPPGDDVRRDVHVRVERAAQQRARTLGDGGQSLDAHPASSASTARAAPVTRGWTPSSRSSSAARRARARGARRARGCPRSSRSTRRAVGGGERRSPRRARNQSSHPAARAAAAPSSRAAARPFMKTERSSFRAAAAPGSGPSTSTLRAERPEQLREPLGAGAGGEQRRAQAAARHGRHHRHVGEEGAGALDGRRDVALQLARCRC